MANYVMSARQAFSMMKLGIPAVNAQVEEHLKKSLVRPVFKDDVKAKGEYYDWLVARKLISEQPVEGARRTGGVGTGYLTEVDKFTGGLGTQLKAMRDKINEQLEAKAPRYEAFVYFKDNEYKPDKNAAQPAAPATPAPAAAPQK